MLRNLAAALALLLVSQTVIGLGLGTLKQSSALNEPFDGRVEILGANARDADTITVKLADEAQFERAGVLREAVLLQLRFTVVDAGAKDYIQISSREPIREPFLNFLLELNWANGRVVREYTVLLDPPLYDPTPRRPSVATSTSVAPQPAPAPVVSAAPPAATSAPAASPRAAAPMAAPGSTLGVVAANDTLWSLASNNRPDSSISVQQMMLALLRANPEAFGDGNINILKRGAVLRMPDSDELTALSRSEALAEVQRQHQVWSGYRDAATETVAEAPLTGVEDTTPEPMSEEAPAPVDEPVADAAADARLELVAPGADDDQMGAGDGATGSADVTLTREELDAQVQANSELQARIAEADEIIDLMRRQVDIKDDELAALQARLAELGIDAPADLTAGRDDEVATEEPMSEAPDDDVADGEDEPEAAPAASDEVDISIGDADESGAGTDDAELAEIDDEIATDDGGGDEASGSSSGGLIPAHIANMVPGGAMTIFGLIAAIVVALVVAVAKLFGGRREEEAAPAVGITTEADDDVTALTEIADDDEPITETRELDSTVVIDQDTVEAEAYDGDVPPELQATSPDMQSTIESSAEDLARGAPPAEPEDDPLEEVNVYLAYERFDQAEELVRKVIADHPDEHKYKLRLLEVYYSSNDKAAYEKAAGELREAIGEDDPLWESAVAMWAEMSPDRALFEEGGEADVAAPAAESGRGFVDITAEADDDAGAKTMSMAPGTDVVLESTQVGLTPLQDEDEDEGEDGGLDFDLGAQADDGGEDDGGMLDLTGGMEEAPDDEVLDLTASADSLDFTLDEEPADTDAVDLGADTTDLAATDGSLLDVTTPELGDGHDLLDVTKTGELAGGDSEDILNVTSPGLLSAEEPAADDDILDISGDGTNVDFDISDTVAPAFDAQEEDPAATQGDDVFDLTAEAGSAADEEIEELDFDIGSLGDDDNDATAEFVPSVDDGDTLDITGGDSGTLDITGGIEEDIEAAAADDGDTLDITGGDGDALDITGSTDEDIEADAREMLEDALELDIPDAEEDGIDTVEMEALPLDDSRATADLDDALGDTDTVPLEVRAEAGAAADFDLSLQGSELDELSIGADTLGGDGAANADDEESEIEFDLALQDTTEMDSLVIDDTLELPKSREPDETLDDLTKSMEESMAELDIDDDEIDLDDDGELDLSLADTTGSLDLELGSPNDGDDDIPSLDFDINDLDIEDLDQADTVAMDLSATTSPETEETVIMPVDESVERQTEADEIDTKLNLAKAYIELGDNDGARSILDEVARDGSEAQQAEAERLISQLS